MALSKKLMAGGLAALALAATAGAAFAAPAYSTSNVNVRSGPGTGYGVVDTLRRGEQVDVQQCSGSWCFVEKRGPDGWVSANYLDRGRPVVRPPVYNPPPVYYPPPPPPVYYPRPPRPPIWGGGRPPRPPHWNGGGRPPYGHGRPSRDDSSVCFNGPNGYACFGN